jgi:hypothetical protein
MGQRAIPSRISRHSYHPGEQTVKSKKLDYRVIGLRKGCGTGLRGVANMPEHPPTDNGGQIHLVGQTMAMLLIGEKIDGQWQATPGQHAHQALLPQRTHQTIEGHRGDMVENRAPLQTQATVCGQQRVASHFRSHLAVAQDEVREHREDMLYTSCTVSARW